MAVSFCSTVKKLLLENDFLQKGVCEKWNESIVATQSRKNNDLLKVRKFYVVERISNEKKPN